MITENWKFSILVPAYKPQFLAECIESILAQTYQNFELLIVNDASPYDIDSIINKYHDRRIKYRKRKKGYGAKRLVENWNDCLQYVTGDYVINMGDDDKLLPNCLNDYYELIQRQPGKNIYHTRVEYINEHSIVTDRQNARPPLDSAYSMFLRKIQGGRICIGEFLFKVSFLNGRGGYYNIPFGWGADDITSYEAAKLTGCANCNNLGFQYRDSGLTITSKMIVNYREYYNAAIYWIYWYYDFIKLLPESDSDQLAREKIIDKYLPDLFFYLHYYIDCDIKSSLLKGWYYWAKRLKQDKVVPIKQRTLLVFLFYALRTKFFG